MNIELKCPELWRVLENPIYEYKCGKKIDISEVVCSEVEKLIHGAESCKEMIDNRRKISDKDFYDMLQEFAYIYDWNYTDCYNVLEMAYNMKFAGDATIMTAMHIIETKGSLKGYSKCGISLYIYFTEDANIDVNHVYSRKEIQKLVDEKKIVIVSEEERSTAWDPEDYTREEYHPFDHAFTKYSMNYQFFNEKGKFYPYTLKYIKQQASRKKLKEFLPHHIDHVNYVMYDATRKEYNIGIPWNDIAEKCSQEFEQRGYTRRLTKLTDKNK